MGLPHAIGNNLGKISMKHSSRRQGQLASKLAVIQEEIERAKSDHDPEISDDRAEALSEDQ